MVTDALILQVIAVLALPVFALLDGTPILRVLFVGTVIALSMLAIFVGLALRRYNDADWGTMAMWLVLAAAFGVEAGLMAYSLTL